MKQTLHLCFPLLYAATNISSDLSFLFPPDFIIHYIAHHIIIKSTFHHIMVLVTTNLPHFMRKYYKIQQCWPSPKIPLFLAADKNIIQPHAPNLQTSAIPGLNRLTLQLSSLFQNRNTTVLFCMIRHDFLCLLRTPS